MTAGEKEATGTAAAPGRDPHEGWVWPEGAGFPATREPGFPRFPTKYSERSVTSPAPFAADPLEVIPDIAVLCYTQFLSRALLEVIHAHPGSHESKVFPGLHFLGSSLALVENTSLLGASMASVQLERLIHLGIRSFIVLGIAGSLQEGVDIGHVVVGDRAVGDEGTSYHYLPPSDYAWPSPELTARVTGHLRQGGLEVQVGGDLDHRRHLSGNALGSARTGPGRHSHRRNGSLRAVLRGQVPGRGHRCGLRCQ